MIRSVAFCMSLQLARVGRLRLTLHDFLGKLGEVGKIHFLGGDLEHIIGRRGRCGGPASIARIWERRAAAARARPTMLSRPA